MSDNNMSRIKNKQNNPQRKNKKDKGKKKKSWIKRIFLAFIGLFLLILVAGGSLFAYYASSAPELTDENLLGSFSTDLVDSQGEVFYTLGGQNRDFAEANDYPEVMKDAMTAIEDQNFYKHFGIDPIGIGRAALGYVTNLGKISGGGSTITQQLIKLSVFSTERSDQTLKRKAQEAWLAIKLERQLSKEQILTLYMNKINMSGNVYGIATASEEYYGKPVEELELQEAALFAGMAQAPNRYNPYVNPEEATNRRNTVLNVMRDNGDITAEEAEKAKAIPIEEGLVNRSDSSLNSQMFDSYLVKVLEEVEEKTGLNPATAGLTIQTNIDMDAQQAAFDIANSEEYVNFPDDELQTAISLVDANTGQVKALVGGRKQEGQLLTNRATSTDRPTGSTIKPLTTYGPAIEYNKFSTYHQLVDEKWSYPDGTPLRNYDGKYVGQLSLREALVDSRNIPTARLFAEEVDRADATEFVENVGLDTNLMSKEGGLVNSNAISGTASPLQMASAYSAFSNGGNYTEPYTVSKVITQDGQEIDLTPKTNQAMSDYTAYMITDMLKDVAANYSSSVGIPGVPQAGKTGTTNYTPEQIQEHNLPSDAVPDSWYVGYTSNYSLSVWTGYDKKYEDGHWLSNKDGTRQLPRDIYQALMSKVSEGLDNSDWTKPASVSEVRVEAGSNPAKLPGPNTPESEIVTELFVAGTEPSEVSTSYGEDLTAPTGLSAQYDEDSNEININWNEYTLQDEDEKATYVLSVNGKEVSVEGTEYTVADPDSGTVQITLSVQAYGNTGPAATTSVTVPEPVEEEPEENTEEEPEANPEEPVEEDTGENDEDVEDKPDDPEEDSNDPNNPEDTEDNPSDESDDNSSTPPADNPGTNTNPKTEE
ncbi:transglycosylase domain-containing protein [Marinilactibacillus psychrotolerans]|uniref:transglycosylase domain-containing protein n=1 Tax=Marinilactibacillus psychrotolerans TaxID=191770 RepID=UPI001865FBF0|nr:transglycosylase domain-containing protein [Marinilactibacillus psychrotolerans]GEQ33455.1 penicillin-binding protein 1A [Marinilactibacillus psychrotolerans]